MRSPAAPASSSAPRADAQRAPRRGWNPKVTGAVFAAEAAVP